MGGLTSLADVADAGRGGGGVQDQNADVINEQMLTKYIYHNEGFFNILNCINAIKLWCLGWCAQRSIGGIITTEISKRAGRKKGELYRFSESRES